MRIRIAWLLESRAEMECDGTRKRTDGEVKGKKANGRGSQQSCTVSDTVYPALLPLIRTPRLPAADWTDTPADINGLVRFAVKPSSFCACAIRFHFCSTWSTFEIWGYCRCDYEDVYLAWLRVLWYVWKGTVPVFLKAESNDPPRPPDKGKEKKIFAVSSTIQTSFLKSRRLGRISVIIVVGSIYTNYFSTDYKESVLWNVT